MEKSQTPIFIILFFRIILTFITAPYTIVKSGLNVSVSASGRLEAMNCGWILERNMDEIDPNADYFGIKSKINPTVLDGGQVARFTEVYTKIQLDDKSKQHIYLSNPSSKTYETSYSLSIGGGESMSWGLSILAPLVERQPLIGLQIILLEM